MIPVYNNIGLFYPEFLNLQASGKTSLVTF